MTMRTVGIISLSHIVCVSAYHLLKQHPGGRPFAGKITLNREIHRNNINKFYENSISLQLVDRNVPDDDGWQATKADTDDIPERMQSKLSNNEFQEIQNPEELQKSRKKTLYTFDVRKINPIRFVFFNVIAILLALGSNFLGSTSFLMSNISPQTWESLDLNALYPINGYRKHIDYDDKYEFKYPAYWFIDRSVILAEVRERELPKELLRRQPRGIRPDVAYQPTIEQSRRSDSAGVLENISVVKSSVLPGFSLSGTLGEDPSIAADTLLSSFIAPSSSGKTYKLLNAYADVRNNRPAYSFEYIITKEVDGQLVLNQHSVSVIMNRDTDLYTFTAVAPHIKWESGEQSKLLEAATSFTLTN